MSSIYLKVINFDIFDVLLLGSTFVMNFLIFLRNVIEILFVFFPKVNDATGRTASYNRIERNVPQKNLASTLKNM